MDAQNIGYFANLMQTGSNFDEQLTMDSQCFNENEQVFVQETQSTAARGSSCEKQQCGSNFTIEEDKLLVSAWLNISMDPVTGTDQNKTTFWQRVEELFHQSKKGGSNRTENSLMNRWSTIQFSTNKFCTFYAMIQSLNQSGTTEEDKVEAARDMYRKFNDSGSAFQFEHCWVILKNQPKWSLECEKKNQQKEPRTGVSKSTPNLVNLGDDNVETDTFVDLEPPMGTKAAKELKRKNSENPSLTLISGALNEIKESIKLVDKKMEMLDRTYAQEREKLRIKKEKLAMEQFKEEERIIMMDLNGLSEDQQAFYKYQKTEILEKRRRV